MLGLDRSHCSGRIRDTPADQNFRRIRESVIFKEAGKETFGAQGTYETSREELARSVRLKIPLLAVAKKVAREINKQADVELDTRRFAKVQQAVKDVLEETAERTAAEAAKTMA